VYAFEMKICDALHETDKVLIGKGHTPMDDAATIQIFQAAGNLI